MANNPDFYKVVTPEMELVYPRLDQPYRYNERDERTEACETTAPQAAWSIAVKFSEQDARAFWKDMQDHYRECQERNPKLPDFSEVFGRKKQEDGSCLFTFRKNCVSREGKDNRPIKVIGPDHNPLRDAAIWSGSKGRVRGLAFPSVNPQDKRGGISLMLDAVLVTDAKYGGASFEEDFGPPVDTFAEGDTPTQPPTEDEPPHPADDPGAEVFNF